VSAIRILLCAATVACILAGCGDGGQRLNEARPLVHRRADSGFAETGPATDAPALARSRQVDEIDRLIDDGRDGEARERLAAYLDGGGDHPRAHLLAGRFLFDEGSWAEAVPHFERAVAGSPLWYEPRHWLAQSFLKLDRPASAEGVYQEVDRLMPEAPWGPWGMGAIAWQRGDTERALGLLDEALRRDPEHAPSLRTRAGIAAIGNDAERERDLLERFLVQRPDDAEATFRLGELAAAAGRATEARRRFTDAWEMSGDPNAAKRLVDLCERAGDPAAARLWRTRAGLPPAKPVDGAKGPAPVP
jgi:uncharacterized protein HemY